VTETETLVKYEVMDGCPDKGEVVPIRMYTNGIELSPSYENIHNRLGVKYWINLVLLDEEDRRYFKQTEITFYRKP
jgi:vacuolar protein sorting-associated protein 26